jgi:hypothetical protein
VRCVLSQVLAVVAYPWSSSDSMVAALLCFTVLCGADQEGCL